MRTGRVITVEDNRARLESTRGFEGNTEGMKAMANLFNGFQKK
jgi:hypothetical protein